MAKYLVYQFLSGEINRGTEDHPATEQLFLCKKLPWSAEHEAMAKSEAKGGHYIIEDDGMTEPLTISIDKRIEAVEAAVQNIPALIAAAIRSAFGKDV